MLLTSNCALRVKADDATVEVVRGKHNLENVWEECSERERQQAMELEEKKSMRDKKMFCKQANKFQKKAEVARKGEVTDIATSD